MAEQTPNKKMKADKTVALSITMPVSLLVEVQKLNGGDVNKTIRGFITEGIRAGH